MNTSIFFAAILVVSYLLIACNDFRPSPPAAPSERDLLPIEITDLKQLTHLLIDAHEITNVDAIQALLPGLRIIDEGQR